MASVPDVARLNVLLEFISDCAAVLDEQALRRVAGGRLRWVLGFERLTLAVARGGKTIYWSASREHDTLQEVQADALPAAQLELIERVLRTATPATAGAPIAIVAQPLSSSGQRLGAVCFAADAELYSFRDLRYAQLAAEHLASALVRIDYAHVQRVSRDKDEFFALLGHELRNPLAPILTAVHLLRMRDGADAPELGVIERQARHLVRLVDDLLDITRLTRAKLSLRTAPIEISQVVRMALERCAPLLEERRHVVSVQVPESGLRVNADQGRLEQVLANLLVNAARYTEPGGHVIVAARRESDSRVLLEVRDTGMGIAPELLQQIFEPFYQAERRAGSGLHGGLGLGLPIVKSLTELHGGSVRALSEGSGKGSTFQLRFPLHEAAGPAGAAVDGGVRAPGEPRRVLIVDDNRDAAETLASVLRCDGHEVRVTYEPTQGLAALESFAPEFAILDIGLPVMDGYALAQAMRARLGPQAPYFIALTGYGRQADRERGHGAGFDRFFVKPVEAEQLTEALRSMPRALKQAR